MYFRQHKFQSTIRSPPSRLSVDQVDFRLYKPGLTRAQKIHAFNEAQDLKAELLEKLQENEGPIKGDQDYKWYYFCR